MKIMKGIMYVVALFAVLLSVAWVGLQNSWFGDLMLKSRPSQFAYESLKSNDQVDVSNNQGWYVFTPKNTKPTTGLIFMPCALCAPEAFAPPIRDIAAEGYLAVITPMPSNFAIWGYNTANDVKAAYPEIKTWILSGHSMGGGSVALYIRDNPGGVDGMLFWDSFTNANYPITDETLPTRVIYGTSHHNGADRDVQFNDSKQYMPKVTEYVAIEGGDHFGFGYFNTEDLEGRMTATIPVEKQTELAIKHTLDFLKQF